MEEYINEKTAIATDWIRKDDLTDEEWRDIYTLWEYAIEQSGYEVPSNMYFHDEWPEVVEDMLDVHFGFKARMPKFLSFLDIDEMVEAAFEEGLEQMLEAYCEGVPLEDILA